MFRRIAVGDIMTRNLATVKPTTNLHDCAKEFVKQRVNTLLIAENRKLVGILTSRDLLWTLTKRPNMPLKRIKAIDIATKKVAVIKPSADIGQAIHKMRKYGFRRLPVLSKGQLVGIVTIKDILRIDPEIHKQVTDLDAIREASEKIKRLRVSEDSDEDGQCDECGEFAPLLRVESRLICPNCRDELY